MKIEELKETKTWCNHQNKIPISPTGERIGPTYEYRKKWCTYDEAKLQVDDATADGIGLILNRLDNNTKALVAIDIDNRSKEDFIVQDIITSINSYTEISPSGNGFHILCWIDPKKIPVDYTEKYYMKNTHIQVECYIAGCTSRYVTFTGNVYLDKDIEERTEQLMLFLNAYMHKDINFDNVREEAKANLLVNNNVPTNNQVILNIIKKSNQWTKFAKLFYDGDISDYNGDDSSADMALASILAYYIGNDVERIAVIMKQSALYRVKYERKDYLEGTIKKSIELHQGNFFNWNGVPTEEQGAIQVNTITTQTARELQQANIEPPVPIVENLLYPRL